tara:strand:+ start:223 stop:495 length:273 start_codon:yes stop_codon:yes gene_type:complete
VLAFPATSPEYPVHVTLKCLGLLVVTVLLPEPPGQERLAVRGFIEYPEVPGPGTVIVGSDLISTGSCTGNLAEVVSQHCPIIDSVKTGTL